MTVEGLLKYPAAFLVAFLVTYLLVPQIARLACSAGLVDFPAARRLNRHPVPRAGGVALFAGFHSACAVIFFFPWSLSFSGILTAGWWFDFLTGSSLLLLVGLIDDAADIKWYFKLAGQTAAGVLMFSSGISVGQFQGYNLPFTIDLIVTLGWFLALTNAFNLIDGLDGLATGLAAIAAVGLAAASLFNHQHSDTLVLLGMLGACLAFLRYNFNPASIFLGDSGSMFLGFTLAAFSLSTSTKGTTMAALGVPVLAMGVPVLDTMLAIWRRSVRAVLSRSSSPGRVSTGIMHADMDHLHHRLLYAGLSQRRAALCLYALNALLVLTGLLSLVYNSRAIGIFIIAFVLGSYVAVRHLARVELWDSGSAFLLGLRRPSRSMLVAVLFPVFDALVIAASLACAITLSSPGAGLDSLKLTFLFSIPVWAGLPFICLILAATYSRVWSRARLSEFLLLLIALASGVLLALGFSLLESAGAIHRLKLQAILHFGFCAALVIGLRVLPRAVQDLMGIFDRTPAYGNRRCWNILVYGAGSRGILYLKHKVFKPASSRRGARVAGFLDDDRNLRGRLVHGYRVLGSITELSDVCAAQRISEIIIAAHLPPQTRNRLQKFCASRGIIATDWIIEEKVCSAGDRTRGGLAPGKAIRL